MRRNATRRLVIGGVDTHAATHYAAVVDHRGQVLGDQGFPATPAGYAAMLAWMHSFGQVEKVGVEGTGAYGAGLARYLHQQQVGVVEVPRPERQERRRVGKSDPIDAEAAARAVLAGKAKVQPKFADGPIEAIRALRVARNGAIKAKTAATNTLHALVVTAPEPLRSQLSTQSRSALVHACLRLRPDPNRLGDPVHATKAALRSVAQRAQALALEARNLELQLVELTRRAAPKTTAVFALGPDTASALLVTIGDNPDRLRSEAAFARLCGVAPIPASSGKTRARPTAIACTGVVTGLRTAPCTSPSWSGFVTMLQRVSTPNAGVARA